MRLKIVALIAVISAIMATIGKPTNSGNSEKLSVVQVVENLSAGNISAREADDSLVLKQIFVETEKCNRNGKLM